MAHMEVAQDISLFAALTQELMAQEILAQEISAQDEFDLDAIELDTAAVDELVMEPTTADECFSLGMAYSAGAGVEADLIEAHKWLNIAASRGHREAAQARREVAELMQDAEIGSAQRAARDWLKTHEVSSIVALRVAA